MTDHAALQATRGLPPRRVVWWTALAMLPGLVWLSAFTWRAGHMLPGQRVYTLFDDAMISMTYAKTLATTGEWVWFAGAPRVQGFTNPLWTLYMALLHLIGLEGSAAALAVTLTGLVLIVATGALVGWMVWRVTPPTMWAVSLTAVAAGVIGLLYPLAFWSLRGMEVGFLAFLLMIVMVCCVSMFVGQSLWQRRWPMISGPLAAVLGVLTRMDFVVLVIALVVAVLLVSGASRRKLLYAGVVIGSAVVAALLTLAFQWVYWGDWLPNTYHLKLGGYAITDRILRGLATIGKTLPILVLLVSAGVASWSRASQRLRGVLAMSVVATFAAAAYSIWVGGDAWDYGGVFNRYVSVVLPVAVVGTFAGFAAWASDDRQLSTRRRRWFAVAIIGSGLGNGVTSNPFGMNWVLGVGTAMAIAVALVVLAVCLRASRVRPSRRWVPVTSLALGLLVFVMVSLAPMTVWARDGGLFVARDWLVTQDTHVLATALGPNATVATAWAGAPAYYLDRPMIDLLGKSDAVVAAVVPRGSMHPGHNKWDYDYSVRQLKPDVVRELFIPSTSDEDRLAQWGYVKRCVGNVPAYFLTGSPNVEWATLSDCP